VEAVAYHPRPERLDTAFGIPTAVHVASILARDPDAQVGAEPSADMRAIPMAYLERLGAANQLSQWRDAARGAPRGHGDA
jgi:hypothetical protein